MENILDRLGIGFAKATHKAVACTPRKLRLLRNALVGKNVLFALSWLGRERRAGSVELCKTIKSAVAQLKSNVQMRDIYIQNCVVNEGPKQKRWMPRAQGRATPILKRTSHLTVVLIGRAAVAEIKGE